MAKTRRKNNFLRAITTLLILAFLAVCVMMAYRIFMQAAYPIKYQSYVERYAQEYGVDRTLIYSVIKCESGFRKDAVSDVGAIGLMQITPETFAWAQTKTKESLPDEQLYDEETNIKYGTKILSLLLAEYKSEQLTLCGYHAGWGKVKEWINDDDLGYDGDSLDTIPFADTRHYVDRVLHTQDTYQKLYFQSDKGGTSNGTTGE
jgi:soluble lytic murein transglycosylase